MKCTTARTTSLALGSTIAILYSLCAVVMAFFPQVAATWVRTVAHGVNLNALEIGGAFTFSEYLNGLGCITIYALIAGYIFGTARNFYMRWECGKSEVRQTATSTI